ncbi:MAG: metallophosphoesterase [Armatimonadota bacterium]
MTRTHNISSGLIRASGGCIITHMSIYAISDLHLSLDSPKPMDIFGEAWRDHDKRIAQNWDALVTGDDTVLIAGDHSWALKFEEAAADIEFIANRPGRKILIRGNHDYWWRRESTNRIQKLLPESITLLHGRGIVVENIGITGTRGWRMEEGETGIEAGGQRVMNRELTYFERGLSEIPDDVTKRIAMLHYPPFDADLQPNAFTELLHKYKVDIVVYGHIHSGAVLEGDVNGVDYKLVAVDHTGFKPVLIV